MNENNWGKQNKIGGVTHNAELWKNSPHIPKQRLAARLTYKVRVVIEKSRGEKLREETMRQPSLQSLKISFSY